MTEQEFLYIQDKSKYYKYSSLRYTKYKEVANYEVTIENEYIILVYGYNTESKSYEYHWVANNDEELVNGIGADTSNVRITFIPNEWILNFENSGFKMLAKWNDYFMDKISNIDLEFESEFLTEGECQEASTLTISCKGQSRGFTGQSKEWMERWVKGQEQLGLETGTKNNTVIIHRNMNGEIVGLICVATYAHESEKGTIVWIREIAVKHEYQRKGIARNLIMQALRYGKKYGATRAFLAADECNKHAIYLYESIGFIGNKDECQNDMFK